jgi:hypothetical protein
MGATEEQEATAEKLHLQNSYLRKEIQSYKKALGKREWFLEAMAECASTLAPIPIESPDRVEAENEQIAVLQFSDTQLGQKTPAEEVGLLGQYDTDIAVSRMRYTFRTFASIVKQQPFQVNTVYVIFQGDGVDHAHLRPGHEQYVDIGVVRQTLLFIDVSIHGLQMLAEQFPNVVCVGVPGNHGRVTDDPRRSNATENFDYLSYQIMMRLLQEQSNISWEIPESWFTLFSIYNYRFLATHGDKGIRSYVGFPWYGATRAAHKYQSMFRVAQQRLLRENQPQTAEEYENCMLVPDYVLMAHFHTLANWEDIDVEILANGTMAGVSHYGAGEKLVISRPSQRMFFVHPKYGVGFRCPIRLEDIG